MTEPFCVGIGADFLAYSIEGEVNADCVTEPRTAYHQLLDGVSIVTKVQFGADEHDRRLGIVVLDLRRPFGADVVERGGIDYAVTHEKHIGLRIRQRTKAIVI